MPGSLAPVEQQLLGRFQDTERRLQALERSQQFVFTDPPGAYGQGDPAPTHGYATVVLGNLFPICGIEAIGLAVWSGGPDGHWTQITT
jgi:hypothetical protein